MPIGALLGSLSGGFLAKFGRRKVLMLTALMSKVGCGLTIFGIRELNFGAFVVGRGIQGVTSGVNATMVPLYNKEMTPLKLSGRAGTYHQLF